MRLILVRHGETDLNKQRRLQGWSDSPLNDTGRKQAEALGLALKDEDVIAIYSSPLRRAQETARAISCYHKVEVKVLEELKELDVGKVDGMTYAEMKDQYSELFDKWMKDFTSVRLPGGGFVPELRDRCCSAVRDIVTREQAACGNEDKAVVAVAHYFPIMSIVCNTLGLDLLHIRRLRLDLASISSFEFNHLGAMLASFNDTCHLREAVK